MVLNRDTGHVSPQFHVSLDPTFRSIDKRLGQQWIAKAGLDARMISRKKVDAPKRKRGRPKGSTRREGASKKAKLAAQGKSKADETSIEVSLETNTNMVTNQEVGKLPSDVVDNQTNMKPNTGSPIDVEDPVQPANPVDDGREKVAASTLLIGDRSDDDDDVKELLAFTTMFEESAAEYDYDDPLTIYKATSDPDTMYHHEAMKEKDAGCFRNAMLKEWYDQVNNKNFTKMLRSKLPKGATVLPDIHLLCAGSR